MLLSSCRLFLQIRNPKTQVFYFFFFENIQESEGYGCSHGLFHSASVDDNEVDKNKTQAKEDIDLLAYRILKLEI